MAALSADGLVNEEALSNQELDAVFGPLRQQVVDSCQRQDMLLARIQVKISILVIHLKMLVRYCFTLFHLFHFDILLCMIKLCLLFLCHRKIFILEC